MIYLWVWIGFAVVTALAAQARDRSAVAWLFIGLLGGVFALLAVLVMRPGDVRAFSDNYSPAQAFSPQAKPINSGSVVGLYNGVMIHLDDDMFGVDGRRFTSYEDARRYIDRIND